MAEEWKREEDRGIVEAASVLRVWKWEECERAGEKGSKSTFKALFYSPAYLSMDK